MLEGLMTVAEFIRLYPIGRTTLYRAVKAGELRLTKIGKASRISKADAASWAASLPTIGGGA